MMSWKLKLMLRDLQCLDNFRIEIRKLFSEAVIVSLNQQSQLLFGFFTGMKLSYSWSGLVMCSWSEKCMNQTMVSWNVLYSLKSSNWTMRMQYKCCGCQVIFIRLQNQTLKKKSWFAISKRLKCHESAKFQLHLLTYRPGLCFKFWCTNLHYKKLQYIYQMILLHFEKYYLGCLSRAISYLTSKENREYYH